MIKLKNLSKKFGQTDIYIDTTYAFRDNALTCFYGPSGSGKSTLLNLIAGFDTAFEGEIEVNEQSLKNLTLDELSKYRFQNVGFIFQDYNLLKGYTAIENVLMGIHLNSEIKEEDKLKKAESLLISLGLKKQINQKVESLSGGQKQRVAIARALINEPKIILADEPTGALDEQTTTEIMEILKEISKDTTVIVITHDDEVAEFADEVIELQDYKIVVQRSKANNEKVVTIEDSVIKATKLPDLKGNNASKLSIKNFKIHLFKYFLAALIIALGAAAFVGSLSTKDITNRLIEDFKEKNFFYNIGQVPLNGQNNEGSDQAEQTLDLLKQDETIENVYYQYNVENINVAYGENSVEIPRKVPSIIAKETVAYGDMPRENTNQVAISSSIANKLVDNITDILGQTITLKYTDRDSKEQTITLEVCGLTNSKYQDFILSSDVEQEIYSHLDLREDSPTAISFTVKEFDDIPLVDQDLKDKAIEVVTRSSEVEIFKDSFLNLLTLFEVLSYVILIIGIAISGIILYKISIERRKEVGILTALGYTKTNIKKVLSREQIYFSVMTIGASFLMLLAVNIFYKVQFGYGISAQPMHILVLIVMNLLLTLGLSSIINLKLINTTPIQALR